MHLSPTIKAGFFYFLSVFGLGFVLGTVRTLVLVPLVGHLIAVLVELPLILSAAWLICARLTTRWAVPAELAPRAAMGILAFGLLMTAECMLSLWLFGNSLDLQLAQLQTSHGMAGFAGQFLFATFPIVQLKRANRHGPQQRTA
jgi:hypothetical protein